MTHGPVPKPQESGVLGTGPVKLLGKISRGENYGKAKTGFMKTRRKRVEGELGGEFKYAFLEKHVNGGTKGKPGGGVPLQRDKGSNLKELAWERHTDDHGNRWTAFKNRSIAGKKKKKRRFLETGTLGTKSNGGKSK